MNQTTLRYLDALAALEDPSEAVRTAAEVALRNMKKPIIYNGVVLSQPKEDRDEEVKNT